MLRFMVSFGLGVKKTRDGREVCSKDLAQLFILVLCVQVIYVDGVRAQVLSQGFLSTT